MADTHVPTRPLPTFAPLSQAINGAPLITLATGAAAVVAPEASRAINSNAMVLLTLLATASVVAATINCAREGEVLGDRWHRIGTPLSFTLSVGLACPMLGGDKSLAQVAIEALIRLAA